MTRARQLAAIVIATAAAGVLAPAASASWAVSDTLVPTSGTPDGVAALDTTTHDLYEVLADGPPFCEGCAPTADALVRFRDGAQAARVALPPGRRVDDAAVDTGDRTVYLADHTAQQTGAGVTIVSGSAVSRIVLDPEQFAASVAVDPSTHTAYVLSRNAFTCGGFSCGPEDPAKASTLSVVRGGAVVATLPVSPYALRVAVDPALHTAYVTSQAGTIDVVRGTTLAPRLRGGNTRSGAIAIDPSTHLLYLDSTSQAPFSSSYVVVVDPSTGKLLRTIPMGWDGSAVYGLAVDPATHTVFANGQSLVVVSGKTVVQRLPAGLDVLLDPAGPVVYAIGGATQVITPSDRPLVTASGPNGNDLAQDVAYAVFSAPMDRASTEAAFSIRGGGGGYIDPASAQIPGSLLWFGDQVLVWRPDRPPRAGYAYAARIADTAKDAAGRRLAVAADWAFAGPARPPARAPVLVSPDQSNPLTPCVYPTTPIYAVFPVAMDLSRITTDNVTLASPAGEQLPFHTTAFGNRILGIVPDTPLPIGPGFFDVALGGLYDEDGSLLSGADISIRDVVAAPTVTTLGPTDGATGVSRTAPPVYAVFGQAMDKTKTAAAFTLRRASDGAVVPGTVSWIGDRVAGFTPSAPLAAGTRYTAGIAATAFDGRGCQLPETKSWSFTTGTAVAGAAGR